ncbi:major capsid protein [Nocardia puris]|uniref:Major capsid protein E n=1 Tax=Nocardia puris TaxID=208602 RepID=A0A366DAE6_9NOCA|nr:major capsid protein [Nocardia puris]RBO87031.1 major capsid protein E [Nocardia puris]
MALFLDGPVPLDATATYTQSIPMPSNLALSGLFPRREFDSDTIDFATITKTNRAARYRNWDGTHWVSARDTGKQDRVRMLPLGATLSMGEYERRQLEFARLGGTLVESLATAVYNDLDNLTEQVYNRIELAWGDVLDDGVLEINENGVHQVLDYGIPTNHMVAPAILWSDVENSTPLDDFVAWGDRWEATTGSMPGQFLTSRKVLRLLQRNKQFINAVHGAAAGRTRVTIPEINDILGGEGLPPLGAEYNSNFDIDGTSVRVLPENKLLFLPDNPAELGFTAWGTPTTALELAANKVELETAAGILGVIEREDGFPYRKHASVDAVGMPVLGDPRKLLISEVIA